MRTRALRRILIALPAGALLAFPPSVRVQGRAAAGEPIAVVNCGVSTTYTRPPSRVLTMNQSATEIALALGLADRLVGTAYLDDAVLPEFQALFARVPVVARRYPSREVVLSVRPDFVYAAYPSAFDRTAAGSREDLHARGIESYLSPAICTSASGTARLSMDAVFGELRDVARIFGVLPRGEALIAAYRAELVAVQQALAGVPRPLRVFWYDEGVPPSAGACCGMPDEILRLARAENIFGTVPGSWATVSWEEVVARNPEVVVLADASWSPAIAKRQALISNRALAGITAIRQRRFVTVPFSSTTPGIRNVTAVRDLAKALYPDRFK